MLERAAQGGLAGRGDRACSGSGLAPSALSTPTLAGAHSAVLGDELLAGSGRDKGRMAARARSFETISGIETLIISGRARPIGSASIRRVYLKPPQSSKLLYVISQT